MIDAFLIPTDSGTAAAAGPIFGLMALTAVGVLIWQAVRYFRENRDDRDDRDERDERDERDDGRDGRSER